MIDDDDDYDEEYDDRWINMTMHNEK